MLRGVRALLHDDGYTIKGVQRLHKEQGIRRLLAAGQGGEGADLPSETAFGDGVIDTRFSMASEAPALDVGSEQRLREALEALEAAKARLKRALSDS